MAVQDQYMYQHYQITYIDILYPTYVLTSGQAILFIETAKHPISYGEYEYQLWEGTCAFWVMLCITSIDCGLFGAALKLHDEWE